MTSTRVPAQDFILTPQQQNLLFAALNSNRPVNTSPSNNALSMSPSSFSGSPLLQKSGVNGFQESPYLEYDYSFDGPDSSFDFSFDNGTGPKMIGDLPNAPNGDKSSTSSPENDSPDKRSHPDDDEEEENDPKRRESTEKIPKKPGRKPLTSEPSSKRKAQNRAAQRAFRERKEKHLKDLETKVTELEKESAATNHENERLRAQVEKMTVELNEYKKLVSPSRSSMGGSRQTFGNPIFSNINDVNFQFEFPKFGQLPGQSTANSASAVHGSPSTQAPGSSLKGQASPFEQTKEKGSPASSGYTSGLDSQTREDLAKFSGIFSPPLTNNNVISTSRSSMDSHFSIGGATTSSPSASSNSNMGPSSSCGTSPEPLTQSPMGFKPVDTLTTIGEEQPNLTDPNQDIGHFANIDVNELGLHGFQFDPQLFGRYRDPQENVSPNGGFDDSFFNDAFDVDFTTPYNIAPSPVTYKKDLIAEIDAAKDADADISANSGGLLTYNKIREKLQSCPKVQNGDFDLDGLCSELQKKAKCSGSGPVVNEKDFNSAMQKYFREDGDDPATCAKELLAERDPQPKV